MNLKFMAAILLAALPAAAQWATFPSTAYTTVNNQLNALLVFQVGAGVPSFNCTPGKDIATNSTSGLPYWCTSSNTWTPFLMSGQSLGSATATTQSAGDNSTKLATTAYTNTIYNLVQTSGSPYAVFALTGTYWNNTSSAYSFDLAAPASGVQQCFGNYQAKTSAVSVIPGSGVTIYFKGVAGTSGSSTGLVSGGAAGDFICLEATDSTTYMAIGAGYGTWTNH